MAKNLTIIDLDELELTNNDLFIRKSCTDLDKKAQLIVEDTHTAILIKDGEMANTLPSGRYPIFDKSDKNVYKVDVIYMSKTAKLRAFWGTINKLNLRDPQTDLRIEVGANGEYEVQVKDPRKFYEELVGADKSFDLEKLKERLQFRLLSEIEPVIAKIMREDNLSYIDLAENKKLISQKVLPVLSKMFEREYGLSLFSFTISKVFIPTEYIDAIEKELATRRMEAKAEKTAKEWVAELERLEDRQFEKELKLRELESNDYEKYLEVCKIIGWNKADKKDFGPTHTPTAKGGFCTKCGHAYSDGDMFCPGCGNKLGGKTNKNVCDKCNHENAPDARFCAKCGNKL